MTRTRVLAAVVTFWKRNGYAPTVRDLMDITGLKSTGTVHYHLRKLRETGMVDVVPDQPRTLRITDAGKQALARIGMRT